MILVLAMYVQSATIVLKLMNDIEQNQFPVCIEEEKINVVSA